MKGRTRSRTVQRLVKTLICLSSVPVVGNLIRYFSRRIDYHLFTFVNGKVESRRFLSTGSYPRIGEGCIFLHPNKMKVGNHVTFGNYVTIYNESSGGIVDIGDSVHIGDHSHVSGVGGVIIGSGVAVSSGVCIFSQSNEFRDKTKPIIEQIYRAEVRIGSNVLVGANSTILPGVKIGANSIVGAGAVVREDVPEWSLAVGVPAVVKKSGYGQETG